MNADAPAMPKQRLKFIDLARSIAIMLMLEGHFVGLTLTQEARDPSNFIYVIWNTIRGFTAPLFFTVAGMIFVFLLSGEKRTSFFKQLRVRKGLRRAAELLFWGYLLQMSLRSFSDYLGGEFGDWEFAFHVLQCIGVGLIALILIAALHRTIGKGSLVTFYAIATMICLSGYVWLKSLPEGTWVPAGWPQIFQNALSGPRSVFPIAPWLAYTLLGGAMGAYVRSRNDEPATLRSCAWFFILAAGIKLIWLCAVLIPMPEYASEGIAWFTDRAFQVILFLGILRMIEIRYGIGVPWMLRIGQETFAIYIFHVIVLYGGLFGFGLNHYFKENLGPWQAAGGAALFISFFAAYAIALNIWKTLKRKNI
jgi:surface polysaccharide O-acyltransferase-like enzyme